MSTNSEPSACSSGCPTQDHKTFGECIRSKGLRIAYCNEAGKGGDATVQRKWDAELDSYRSAVAQGMEPESTRTRDIRAAENWSQKTGVAYSAETAHELRWAKALERAA